MMHLGLPIYISGQYNWTFMGILLGALEIRI